MKTTPGAAERVKELTAGWEEEATQCFFLRGGKYAV